MVFTKRSAVGETVSRIVIVAVVTVTVVSAVYSISIRYLRGLRKEVVCGTYRSKYGRGGCDSPKA